MKAILYILLLSTFLAGMGGGCSSESRRTTMHEPGVYKGAKDPLLVQQEQQQALIDRFKLVQTDR
jgi:hypothetical protein